MQVGEPKHCKNQVVLFLFSPKLFKKVTFILLVQLVRYCRRKFRSQTSDNMDRWKSVSTTTTTNYTPLHSTPLHSTTTTTTTTLHYTTLITLHYTTLNCTTLHYTTLDYTKLQLQLQLHYTTTTTTAALHHTTSYYIQQLWVRWPTRWPLQPW